MALVPRIANASFKMRGNKYTTTLIPQNCCAALSRNATRVAARFSAVANKSASLARRAFCLRIVFSKKSSASTSPPSRLAAARASSSPRLAASHRGDSTRQSRIAACASTGTSTEPNETLHATLGEMTAASTSDANDAPATYDASMPAVPKSGHSDAALPLEDAGAHSETYIVVTLVLTPTPTPTTKRPNIKHVGRRVMSGGAKQQSAAPSAYAAPADSRSVFLRPTASAALGAASAPTTAPRGVAATSRAFALVVSAAEVDASSRNTSALATEPVATPKANMLNAAVKTKSANARDGAASERASEPRLRTGASTTAPSLPG